MNFADLLITGASLGAGATLFMDALAVMRQGWDATNGFYKLVGRWVVSIPSRGWVHEDIRSTPPVRFEGIFGWAAHFLVGLIFGAAFVALFGPSALIQPKAWQGLSFGIVTALVPWLIFQPLFGWGFAASLLPNSWRLRGKTLFTHATFGIGLWVSSLALVFLPL